MQVHRLEGGEGGPRLACLWVAGEGRGPEETLRPVCCLHLTGGPGEGVGGAARLLVSYVFGDCLV